MKAVYIHQRIKTSPREGVFLISSIVEADSGEIFSQEFRLKHTSFLDYFVESVLEDITQKAEEMGYEVKGIYSPYLKMIEERKWMLGGD